MLLLGYVEKHKETCNLMEECPLIIMQNKKKRAHSNDQEMEDTIINLKKELERVYQQGLKKFPTCVNLRLSYGFFLMERIKNKIRSKE